jgi:two-component system cell cycle sensor histidine kinase/response regulator CckA
MKVVRDDISMENETIILVDDDEGVRRLARFVLEAAGYQVFEANGGEEALMLLSHFDVRPSLLITDLEMPKMNGFQVASAMKVLVSDVAILFISGNPYAGFSHDSGPNDGAALLPKPFTSTALLKKVREILDRPSHTSTT